MFTPSLLSCGSHTSEFLFPSAMDVAIRRGSRVSPPRTRSKSPQHRHSAPQIRTGRALIIGPGAQPSQIASGSSKVVRRASKFARERRKSPSLKSPQTTEGRLVPTSSVSSLFEGLKGWKKLQEMRNAGVLMPQLTFLVRKPCVSFGSLSCHRV